jgi:hypothetical protein
MTMKRFVGYAAAMLIGLATGATLANGVSAHTLEADNVQVKHGTDAAYRDGLFMGKHDAEEGRLRHVSAGRWSTPTDRAQYQTGYDAGFSSPEVK